MFDDLLVLASSSVDSKTKVSHYSHG